MVSGGRGSVVNGEWGEGEGEGGVWSGRGSGEEVEG